MSMVWHLSAESCRRLLALAWVAYGAADDVVKLRLAVRAACRDGAITSEQIETEWKGQQ
jgi:hypothetical protein